MTVHVVGIHHRRIDGRRFQYRAFRSQIACGEQHRARQARLPRLVCIHNHLTRVDLPRRRQPLAHRGPTFALLPPEPTIQELERAGGHIVFHDQPHTVAGLFTGSGQIERITEYETGLAGHYTWCGDVGEADPLIMDERFLAAEVRGRGVTVLSACSHAGVVNACLGAKTLYPDTPTDVVLGGYHLAGGLMEDRIPATVRDLVELINPRIVAPGHCTGWRAKVALAEAFAPGRYGPSVVGSRYLLSAPR